MCRDGCSNTIYKRIWHITYYDFEEEITRYVKKGWKIREEGMFENHEQMLVHWVSFYKEVSG